MGTIQSLKTKKLGDLINLAKGKKHTETKDITATRYIQIEDINGSDNLKYTKQKNGIRVYLNNIILVWDGANAGKVGIGLDGIIGSTLARMTIDSEVAYPKFVYWYLNSKFDLIKTQRTGATIPHISQSAIRNLLIPLPPLETQKKIAAILDKADELRQNDKKILQKYEQLAQSVFLEMFGDPVRNERRWEKILLKDIGIIKTGNTPPRKFKEYYGDYIEWIKTDNINTPEVYLTKATEYLSEKGLSKGRLVKSGAILVTCIAGSRAVIGNAAIADRNVTFNQQINALQPLIGSSVFWYYQFKVAKRYVQSFSTNSMKGMINKSQFESIEFINPTPEKQRLFEIIVNNIHEQIRLSHHSFQKSEELFQSLLQRAYRGELE